MQYYIVPLFNRLLCSDAKALTTIPDGNAKRLSVASGRSISSLDSDLPETPENYEEICEGADLYNQWGRVIANWDEVFRKRTKEVREMVRQGIPNALRGMVWQLLCGARDSPLKDDYPKLIKVIPCQFSYYTILLMSSVSLLVCSSCHVICWVIC